MEASNYPLALSLPLEKTRLIFVDLLRGWAILVMIETHVFNAMIVPGLKETTLFDILSFINGMVAPSFLFVSGFVFFVSSRRKIGDFRRFGAAFWKQMGRMALIWFIAYGLHLPSFSFKRMFTETTAEGWLKFYQVDILHCIVAGWLFLLFCLIFIRSEVFYRRWMTVSGLVTVFVTPFLSGTDLNQFFPAPISAYFNGQHYSIFPLFPWLGFMILGGLTASLYVKAMSEGYQKQFMIRLALIAASLVALSSLLSLIPLQVEYASTGWRDNPLFFFIRFGVVLLLLATCWYYADRWDTRSRQGAGSAGILDVSRESLFVYVAHLLIIYGKYSDDKSFEQTYGKTFSTVECLFASLGLAVLMSLTARYWSWLKGRSRTASRAISYAVAAAAVIIFFIKES